LIEESKAEIEAFNAKEDGKAAKISPGDARTIAAAVSSMNAQALIRAECDALKAMLLAKNEAYGNSALEPVRIFSKAGPIEQILVRLDDKLSRMRRGKAAGEDVELDLLGYLALLRIARRQVKEEGDQEISSKELRDAYSQGARDMQRAAIDVCTGSLMLKGRIHALSPLWGHSDLAKKGK